MLKIARMISITGLMAISSCALSEEEDEIATDEYAHTGWAACNNLSNGHLCFRGVTHQGLSSTDMLYHKVSGGPITARFYLRDRLLGQLIWDAGWFQISAGQSRTYIFTGYSIFGLQDECMAVQGQSDICVI